jgi:energy-coupling factor transporter ATP-binding protein EcfA2
MLKSLHIENLTVFPKADLVFGKNLNIVIGENGLGKTHLLKILYSVLAVLATGEKRAGSASPTKAYLQSGLASKLREVFKPDELGRLARRQAGRNRCEIGCAFENTAYDLSCAFNTSSKTEVSIEKVPLAWVDKLPVFLPTRELMSIYPGFVSLYELNRLPIEETWRDTCLLLGGPLAKGARENRIRKLLAPLETSMGGTIVLEGERFYLESKSGRIEMNLLAEGLRKLAMLGRLIATGALLDKGTLFWDEPEANLNPKVIKLVARTILDLSTQGIQVFIATHSLFLLRELFILQQAEFSKLNVRCFGLRYGDDGGATINQGPSIDDVGDIASLDEDLMQSVRYSQIP